jgi:hypothetical protein
MAPSIEQRADPFQTGGHFGGILIDICPHQLLIEEGVQRRKAPRTVPHIDVKVDLEGED